MRRPNLEVLTCAHACRIGIEDGRAARVSVRRDRTEQSFPAAKGVVLAAGAFGSPQLLMLSGVGPGAQLQSVGIPVVRDVREIGENLQDHPLTPVVMRTKGTDSFRGADSALNLFRYFLLRTGMLCSNAIEAFGFTRVRTPKHQAPDLEIIFAPLEWRNEGLEAPREHAMTFASVAVGPKSRGASH